MSVAIAHPEAFVPPSAQPTFADYYIERTRGLRYISHLPLDFQTAVMERWQETRGQELRRAVAA